MTIRSYVNDITTEFRIAAHTCGECGVVFGMGAAFIEARKGDGRTWYCPNGHPRVFTGDTEAQQLRKRLERAEARATHAEDQRQATERSLIATKGHVTRAKKRAAAGVCQWCNRSFQNVQRHVAGQHPEHAAEHGVKP